MLVDLKGLWHTPRGVPRIDKWQLGAGPLSQEIRIKFQQDISFKKHNPLFKVTGEQDKQKKKKKTPLRKCS